LCRRSSPFVWAAMNKISAAIVNTVNTQVCTRAYRVRVVSAGDGSSAPSSQTTLLYVRTRAEEGFLVPAAQNGGFRGRKWLSLVFQKAAISQVSNSYSQTNVSLLS
jgi:hypothetical protein